MSTRPSNGIAWLQKIDNGILVHYYIPVKYRSPRHQERESWEVAEDYPAEPVPEHRILERYGVKVKTVFCATDEEVHAAIDIALKASATIEEYRQEGKINPGYPFP